MHKKNNMLREKRKHANYKPNRRLDAKSSRGMIYENEELRIRTININAEVERGQSEIKTLKRDKAQLQREIWTLRDEYDKLENLLRIKGIDPDEFMNQNKNGNNHNDDDDDENASDCSECSCDECCDEDCCTEKPSSDNQTADTAGESSNDSKSEACASTSKETIQQPSGKNATDESNKQRSGKDRLNLNFDHLSIVSEEASEGNNSVIQTEDGSIPMNDLSAFLHNVDVLSPLSYLQKLNPPLAHFENLNYEQIGGSNVDQHGNIMALAAERSAQKSGANVVHSNISIATPEIAQPTPAAHDPTVKKVSRLKHFFSPIRKKSVTAPTPPTIPPTNTSQPDVFISNMLPNNLYVNPSMIPPNGVNQSQNHPPSKSTNSAEVTNPTSSFQTGGNLEELLFDIEALSKDIMELQTQCTNSPTDNETVNRKPFRSELNLVLSYPGDEFQGSFDANSQITPPVPAPMELITPSSQTNPLLLQHLPTPFPSPIPSSPLTPPMNFKTNDMNPFDRVPDYSHLNFPPINAPVPAFTPNSSVFCTVSAPSTPASDRKCIDKFCINETTNEPRVDKKKSKRVSIFNTAKDDANDKAAENQDVNNNESKEGDKKSLDVNPNHHSHMHRNHSHSHLHPKRRMSLDNNLNSSKHKNHRQICHDPSAKVQRRESNRSSISFKKRSRSDSNFMHGDDAGGTSVSERYSNSLASSRESSTSLSLKSGKRRISITSYGGSKKIPWCGCWGNSCL